MTTGAAEQSPYPQQHPNAPADPAGVAQPLPTGATIINALRLCERCQRKTVSRLVRNITSSGVSQVYWYCLTCKQPITKPGVKWISHQKIKEAGYNPDNLPVIENYSGSQLCAVCGSPHAEYHHFAPRHLFGNESDKWPTAYLCKKHHSQWHTIVTPNMGRRA